MDEKSNRCDDHTMETLEDKRTTRHIDILNTFFCANAHLLCACLMNLSNIEPNFGSNFSFHVARTPIGFVA